MTSICEIAIVAIRTVLAGGRYRVPDPSTLPAELVRPGASFVTLESGSQLLGCVGTLEPVRPLGIDVARHAVGAAFADPRVKPITRADYEVMSVKVSVLSMLQPLEVDSLDELGAALRPQVDGLVVHHGTRRATFLPSVWAKVSQPATFVDALWEKAGLRRGAWPADMRLATYTTAEYSAPPPRQFS